jgi:beta-phosphoglucomutase-like phosphatase (HAD superfamily)
VVVDGVVAAREHVRGKPAPDMFLLAAERVGVAAADAVVLEDALSGVAAGRAGGFGLVIGVDRGAGAEQLLSHGADAVVGDLAELVPG